MHLIKNYGLLWRRELVPLHSKKSDQKTSGQEWPRSGVLLGIGVKKKKQGKVDFAQQRGIYALYDDQFKLIYVG